MFGSALVHTDGQGNDLFPVAEGAPARKTIRFRTSWRNRRRVSPCHAGEAKPAAGVGMTFPVTEPVAFFDLEGYRPSISERTRPFLSARIFW